MSSTQTIKSFLTIILGLVFIGLLATSFMRWMYAQKIESFDNGQVSSNSSTQEAMNGHQAILAAYDAQNQAVLATQQIMKNKLEAQVQYLKSTDWQQHAEAPFIFEQRFTTKSLNDSPQKASSIPTEDRVIASVSNSEDERRKSRDRINKETCEYWSNKYQDIQSQYNKSNKEKACNRYYASRD